MSSGFNIVLIGAGLLSLSAGAMAQPAASPMGGPGKFSSMSRTQLQTMLEQHFDAADTNHDGTLTPDERAARTSKRRAAMRETMFARLDADKNGAISKDEFNAARALRNPQGADTRGHHRRRHAGMMMRRQLVAFADKPITKSAFVSAGLARFDRIDADHDGMISPTEHDAARKVVRDRLAPAHVPPPPPPGS